LIPSRRQNSDALMPLAAWRENSSRHVASLRRIRLVFFIAPVSSTITGRDYPQWTDLRKYVAELPVTYYRLPALPEQAQAFFEPLIERAQAGVAAVAKAVEAGELRIDDELHLTPLAAEEEEPELVKLRAALDHRIGEAQLPELLLEVDAKVRFSWIMLGREPRSEKELLMVYAGILAHGTSMSAAETARM